MNSSEDVVLVLSNTKVNYNYLRALQHKIIRALVDSQVFLPERH